jgi:hypothetical protein
VESALQLWGGENKGEVRYRSGCEKPYAINFMKPIHVELADEAGELTKKVSAIQEHVGIKVCGKARDGYGDG